MIKINETSQRAEYRISYVIKGDILTVTIDDISEAFDFTDMADGIAEEILVETLPINPIVSVSKINGVVEIVLIRFYSFAEKEMFENGEN